MSGLDPSERELRRPYHDQIADVRGAALQIVAASPVALADATAAVVDGDAEAAARAAKSAEGMGEVSRHIGATVLDLIALEAPLARDLRLLIASRDVAQLGMLTLGLCSTLAGRAPSVHAVMDPVIRHELEAVQQATGRVLVKAEQAWAGIDAELAAAVIDEADQARVTQLELLAALLTLRDVPMDAALDLGMVSRAYERITDHAVEIAQQVMFAAG